MTEDDEDGLAEASGTFRLTEVGSDDSVGDIVFCCDNAEVVVKVEWQRDESMCWGERNAGKNVGEIPVMSRAFCDYRTAVGEANAWSLRDQSPDSWDHF